MDKAIFKRRTFGIFITLFLFSNIVFAKNSPDSNAPEINHVIVLSDSHGLGPFGELLEQALYKEPNTQLYFYALGGSNPEWWFSERTTPRGYVFLSSNGVEPTPHNKLPKKSVKAPEIHRLLEEVSSKLVNPKDRIIVIISQGTNQAGSLESYSEWFKKMIISIYKTKSASCLWISPPDIRIRTEASEDHIYKTLLASIFEASKEVSEPHNNCLVVNSLKYTSYPKRGSDGWHYPLTKGGFNAVDEWFKETMRQYGEILKNNFSSEPQIESTHLKKSYLFLTKNKP